MKKILLVGGDGRMQMLYEGLCARGFDTQTMGVFNGDTGYPDKDFDAVILPVPSTRDGKTVYCPVTNREIALDIFETLPESVYLLCGAYTPSRKNFTDYCTLDDYALLNAVPTAEGAIAEAIRRTPFTLWKSRVLVIGCGRVARILTDRLLGMKCSVTVSARKPSDFAWLDALGISSMHTCDVPAAAESFDVIFNTVDAPVLSGAGERLKAVTVLDLSTKGCMPAEERERAGVIMLPALPGRIAPDTAGKILTDVIIGLL